MQWTVFFLWPCVPFSRHHPINQASFLTCVHTSNVCLKTYRAVFLNGYFAIECDLALAHIKLLDARLLCVAHMCERRRMHLRKQTRFQLKVEFVALSRQFWQLCFHKPLHSMRYFSGDSGVWLLLDLLKFHLFGKRLQNFRSHKIGMFVMKSKFHVEFAGHWRAFYDPYGSQFWNVPVEIRTISKMDWFHSVWFVCECHRCYI